MTYIGFVAKTQKKDILNDKLYYVDSTFDHIFKGTCSEYCCAKLGIPQLLHCLTQYYSILFTFSINCNLIVAYLAGLK